MSNKKSPYPNEPNNIHVEHGLRRSLKDVLKDRCDAARASGGPLTRQHYLAYPIVPGQKDKYVGLDN